MKDQITSELNNYARHAEMKTVLHMLERRFPGQLALSSSLGEEDQVLTHLICEGEHNVRIFTLDTGRLFNETYETLARTRRKYGREIEVWFPETSAVEALMSQEGPLSFYESVDARKHCCQVRKVEPLKRALRGAKVWITGLRAGQSGGRAGLPPFQWDPAFGIIKYNPLHDWNLDQVRAFIESRNVPVNPLHRQGFVSIGCAPCTRAIEEGEDIRAGRWWWEDSHKECGLHVTAMAAKS